MAGLRERLRRQRARRRDADSKLAVFTQRLAALRLYLAQRPRLAAHLARDFNLRFTSGHRTPEENKRVGGVPNSWHIRGTPAKPGAIDMVGTMADMQAALAWARAHVPDLAEGLIHNVGSGTHLHLGGFGVADWQHPHGGRLKRLRAKIGRQRKRRADAERRIAEIKAEIARQGLARPAAGIDVSSHQGVVDFAKVRAAGYEFAWIKAGEGADFVDPMLTRNVKDATAAGLKVGGYHFLRPRSGRSGAVEARAFHALLDHHGLGTGDLRPVLDVEVSALGNDATDRYVRQALVELAKLTGSRPLFYTFPSFMGGSWPADFDDLADLWIANYNVPVPKLPPPWQKYAAWQHSSEGRVLGVNGNCDVNKTGNLKALIA